MATEPASPAPRPQRTWRAACPNCGAPVEFASAASASAVCSFCRSTLLREGEALRRIGESAELFDDHTPLQLGVTGRHQGLAFRLVGRLQWRYAQGGWNEWHLLFDGAEGEPARAAWLSEDNGAHVLSFDQPPLADAPPADTLQVGARLLLAGQAWSVASVQPATLAAAEGELPRPPGLGATLTLADLRGPQGEVATLAYTDPAQAQWSIGRSVSLAELALAGLREGSEQTLGAQGLACPSCGTALRPTLASTRSISCPQCRAVVDISQGVGADLAHHAQNNSGPGGLAPQIPLGRTGRLALGAEGPLDWQVVGYQERCDLPAPDDEEETQTFWREYLLYHRTAGFAFLVDAEDGWSWMRPLTGAPVATTGGARWQDRVFRERYRYDAKVTWVQGEFYWQVQREERAEVTDYDGPGGARLSREKTAAEVTWSLGQALDVKTVADAFRLDAAARAAMGRDAAPLSGLGGSLGAASGSGAGVASGISQGVVVLIVVILVMIAMARCSSDDCDETKARFGASSAEYQQCQRNRGSGGVRTSGGSYGGYSSGGGHK